MSEVFGNSSRSSSVVTVILCGSTRQNASIIILLLHISLNYRVTCLNQYRISAISFSMAF